MNRIVSFALDVRQIPENRTHLAHRRTTDIKHRTRIFNLAVGRTHEQK
jgi:hypothetical protein